MPPPDLRIVIDATCPWRIAREIAARGYPGATSAYELGQAEAKDPPWLRFLGALPEPVVLVTFDNAMPVEHDERVRQAGIALAVIDSKAEPPELTREQYWRDVIHRHAHRFAAQAPGSRWKYTREARRRLR